jgi:chlorite dismutase
MNPRLFHFAAGPQGEWSIVSVEAIAGPGLPNAPNLTVRQGEPTGASVWALRGVRSNERYTSREEKAQLSAKQADLGRKEADYAVLIPIRKSAAWWALTQEERLTIFGPHSRHTAIGLDYLPAVARRLFHCRDLATEEGFDFLTWFEFAHNDLALFDKLLARLRATPEWNYVDREVEVRLIRS